MSVAIASAPAAGGGAGRAARRVGNLDVLRALAALAVLAGHAYFLGGRVLPVRAKAATDVPLITLASGVWLFFALSGYVIARPFVDALVTGRPLPAVGRYLRRRATRIFPLYWVTGRAASIARCCCAGSDRCAHRRQCGVMPTLRSQRRLVLALIAGVVPLVPIGIGLSLGGAGATPSAASAPSPFTPAATTTTSGDLVRNPAFSGSLVATLRRPVMLLKRPDGRAYGRLAVTTPFGSRQAMLVVRSSGPWLGVLSPVAGNGRVGWIRAGSASLSRVRWRIDVSLSRRRVTVRDNGRVLRRYTVAIGAPASPTPTGRFAVTDRLRTGDPAGPYGCCILALSATSPHAIQAWSGGNRIAIHSTPETSSIGQPVSHGCMRLTLAEGSWLIRHVPAGTPAVIHS